MTDHIEVIAEVGVNHNGDLSTAKKLVDAAVASGVDTVKFQTFSASMVAVQNAPIANYQNVLGDNDRSQQEMLRQFEFQACEWRDLWAYCKSRGIGFLSTAFDFNSVELLLGLGQTRFKVPSGEIDNLPYLSYLGKYQFPVLLSSGMSTMEEVGTAINILEDAGTSREKITVLHCTTQYPTPVTAVNLRALQAIKDAFGVEVGYSDHTLGIDVAIAAAALGACVIEKHVTLDRSSTGPDHKASIEPNELNAMVTAIRNIEKALGDGKKRPTAGEIENLVVSRRSIVAGQYIQKGEVLTEDKLSAKRPGTGISPSRWKEVLGSIAPRNFEKDEIIEL
jgi:N,N'-diacetyllegionaminate synthase